MSGGIMRRLRSGVWELSYYEDDDEVFSYWHGVRLTFPTKAQALAHLVALRMQGVTVASYSLVYKTHRIKKREKRPEAAGIRSVRQARQERRFK